MIRQLVFGVSILLLVSCTTNETNPASVSMGDLLFGKKRLNTHLDRRRSTLDGMIGQTAELSLRVYQKEKELKQLDASVQRERQQLGSVNATQQELEQESKRLQSKLSTVEQQLNELNGNLDQLQRERASKGDEQQALTERIAQNEENIAALENEMALLERAIDRIVTARAQHGLATE